MTGIAPVLPYSVAEMRAVPNGTSPGTVRSWCTRNQGPSCCELRMLEKWLGGRESHRWDGCGHLADFTPTDQSVALARRSRYGSRSAIHEPRHPGLQNGVRVLTRTMQRASAALGDPSGRVRNRLRSVTRRVLIN